MGGKAKRARERTRMATRTEVLQRVEDWIDTGLLDDNSLMLDTTYNSCALNAYNIHAENCSGDCPKLNKWEIAIVLEKEMLKDNGVDPDKGLLANSFNIDVKLDAVISLLEATGVIDSEALELKYQQLMYKALHNVRTEALPRVKQDMIRDAARKRIMLPGPNGGIQ